MNWIILAKNSRSRKKRLNKKAAFLLLMFLICGVRQLVRTITIYGEPIAKGRPRFYAGRAYTPQRTRQYEEKIRTAYRARYGNMDPLAGPVSVCVSAYFKIPSGWNKSRTADAEHDIILPTKKPDIDNIMKCIDGLNGIAWNDDSQIVMISGQKYYSTDPRLVITVWPIVGEGNKGQKNYDTNS